MNIKNLLLAFGVIICIAVWAISAQAEIRVEKDILILTKTGIDIKGDLFVPDSEAPYPIVVSVHGGGFVRGDKSDMTSKCRRLAEAGYLVFNVNYRTLSMGVAFPEFVKDVHTAVKWITAHGAEYGGDPEKMGIMGVSAGSYISSIVAVTTDNKKFQHKSDPDVSNDIDVLVAFYGHHDMEILDDVQRQTARLIFGGKISDKALQMASPAYYKENYVPSIFFHNEIDPLVPVEQSRSMNAHLKEAGVPAYYYEFPEKAHDLLRDDEKWAVSVAIDFLDKYLKGKENITLPESIPERHREN